MKKNKYIIIAIVATVILLIGIVYLVKDNNSIFNNKIDIYNNENSNNDEVSILLEDNNIKVNGSGVSINGNTVTITKAGTYRFNGSLSDGQIIVDTTKNDEVTIVLDNVNITCSNSSVIYSKQALKTVLKLASNNTLTDTANYEYESSEDEEPNATIFSKDDLVITGDGTLNLKSNFTNSIFSKDGLIIESGNINVDSVGHGIKGRDYVYIKNGNIDIVSGFDGIKTTNDIDEDKGYIVIENGNIKINAAQDGISSEKYIKVLNGTFDITTGGGSLDVSSSQNSGMWGKNMSTTEEPSAKGIKTTGNIEIENGTFNINSSDDSIHSNSSITIDGGTYEISSGDDGIHADTLLTINSGKINITKSYEGLESENITINDGDIDVVSSDDGINVSGGNDMSAISGRPGQNNFSNTTVSDYLTINGGNIYVNATGDGLDSNGGIIVTGGEIFVDGPTNDGNGALDYDSSFEISGGRLIAVGSSGMAQSVSDSSSVNTLFITFSSTQNANTTIYIKDNNGNNVITYKPSKTYQNSVICDNNLQIGGSYSVYVDDTKMYDVTISNTI